MVRDKLIRQFTIYGVLFGMCFPVIALTIDLIDKDLGFYIDDMLKIHSITPIHYIVDLAPIILGGTAYLIGKYVFDLEKKNITKLETELQKSYKYTEYIKNLIDGNYDFKVDFGEGGENLQDSLTTLRDSLLENEEKEKMQNWTSKGLGKFIEVLRSDVDNISVMTDRILANLVSYVGANQGGIYLSETQNDETVLRLTSAYAYSQKKYVEKIIKSGEGLIGQVYIEKELVHLKEIPEDYIRITSGLGESVPKSLLIMPLLINGEIFGIIELASFKEFKDFEIEFVEQLAENIAATISSIRTAEQTSTLLKESQVQAEMMRSQEEEMRQNMEELTATQEEMERKELEYQKQIEQLREELKQHA